MSEPLEVLIPKLTAAVERLNANIEAGKLPAAGAKTADKPAAPKAADKPKKVVSKHTPAEVSAAIMEVKEKVGKPSAQAIIEEHGGAGCKLAALVAMPDKFDAIMESCQEALEEAGGEAADDEDDM